MTKSLTKYFSLTALIILIDQLTKLAIEANFQFGESKPITSFFNLVLAYNPGAAFSFLADHDGWQRWFFTMLAIGVSLVLAVWLSRTPRGDWRNAAPLALVIGGALGNLIDRLRHGHVVDFVQVYWREWVFPAFNVADSAITVGAAMLILFSLLPARTSTS